MPTTRAKSKKAGAPGIPDHGAAVDRIGSGETNVSSGVPVLEPPGPVANARAMRYRARGRREPKSEAGRAGMNRDPHLQKRLSLPPFKWTFCRKSARSLR
jgi:hypothetical protein